MLEEWPIVFKEMFRTARSGLPRGALAGLVVIGLGLAAAQGAPDQVAVPTLASLQALYRRPAAIPFPAANPYSDAKLRLGQALFFDPRLSRSNATSCASCHNPALGWEDGLRRARGDHANTLRRASPTILNLAWAEPLMWDGRKDSLEDQALGPVTDAGEMNQPLDELVAELGAVPGYRRMFGEAFGQELVTGEGIAAALATFERTIVSNLAPFDRWVAGDAQAISASAQNGFRLFNGKANCAACHSGWRLTDDSFHDIGLPSEDLGRGALMPDLPVMQHAFKTPTLRNVAQRAPYMHDGSVATMAEAIRHYDTGFIQRPSLSAEMRRLSLTDAEVADLVAFLRTLTSEDDPMPLPNLPANEE
jgi:cytochrome c peroxidase